MTVRAYLYMMGATAVTMRGLAQGAAGESGNSEASAFLPRTMPSPLFYTSPPRDYNLKWGKLTGRLYGSLQSEFNDNINLSQADPQNDVILGPNIGIGFLWPVSEKNLLQFDIGVGYRTYLNHPELNSLQISPDSRLNYQIRILKAQITVHDQFAVQVDPLSRPELSGGSSLLNFRRFNNDLGFDVSWEAIRDVTLTAGYDYMLDRSLNSDFQELDRDDHLFHFAAYRPFGSRVTAGLVASYTTSEYVLPIQNNGQTLSAGPHFVARLGEFLTADAGLNYTRSTYDQTGSIQDQSDFEGLTYSGGLNHRMNSRTTEYVRLSKNISPGYHSNFTDLLSVQYGLSVRLTAAVSMNGTFAYEDVTSSGAGAEESSRYIWYLGTALRISKHWNVGGSYSFAWKDSSERERDYTQNRVTLDITRNF